jgi:Lrp/AsnC family transcriptional regulator, leucine-responsive regulatory protein
MAKIVPFTAISAILCGQEGDTLTFMPEPGDRTDRAILATLQRDGRIANVDLAEAVSLSPSACLRRVKALEASGIIEGYRAEIGRSRAGLGLTAFIGVRVESHSRATADEIERALTSIPAVVGCYLVTGSDDYMVEIAARDMADYEDLLLDRILAIPAVVAAHSTFAIRTVLSRGPIPLTHWR